MQHRRPEIRQTAARTLVRTKGPSAVRALRRGLKNPDPEVRRTADGYQVVDVGSLNGTYLNRERVETADLHEGDELQIGTFKLLFLAGRT